jgi:signal peptidase I
MSNSEKPKKQPAKEPETVREYVESALVTAILALFMISFVVQGFEIPSSSMENTLLIGDRLLANKVGFAGVNGDSWGLLPYRPVRRGDIIIFKYPYPPHIHFVKRVVAVPGDRLKIVNRQVLINGEPMEESYKHHRESSPGRDFRSDFPPASRPYSTDPEDMNWFDEFPQYVEDGELVIPEGKYFAMGDNRDNSRDSRYWGLVSRENIVARPLVIYWSFGWGRK